MRRWVSFDGIDTEDFGFVLCDIDVCFCDIGMEFQAYQQTAERELGRGSVLSVMCDLFEVLVLHTYRLCHSLIPLHSHHFSEASSPEQSPTPSLCVSKPKAAQLVTFHRASIAYL